MSLMLSFLNKVCSILELGTPDYEASNSFPKLPMQSARNWIMLLRDGHFMNADKNLGDAIKADSITARLKEICKNQKLD